MSTKVDSESLKRGIVMRIALLAFGLCVSATLLQVLRLLNNPPTPDIFTRSRPYLHAVQPFAFVQPVVALALLGLLIYGVYDTVRTFMRYRKSKQDEQEMFP